jgi:hypothetical protein
MKRQRQITDWTLSKVAAIGLREYFFAMQLSLPLFALLLVMLPMVFLTFIAAIFNKIAVTTKLQCGDTTRSAHLFSLLLRM